MIRAFKQSRAPRKIVPGMILAVAMGLSLAATPAAHATIKTAAPVTTSSVTYLLEAQVVGAARAATIVHGWVSGSLDSAGLLTATVTSGQLVPLTPGCAPYADFAPPCVLPASANLAGNVTRNVAALTAKGKGWSWVLAGGPGATGSWAGTLTQGGAGVGSWALTPATTTIHMELAVKSDVKSADKIVVVGAFDLHVTLDGRAAGTFSPNDGSLPTVVQGWANNNTYPSAAVSLPMPKGGSILFTTWSRQGFGTKHWNGFFVGPAKGDYGIVTGQG